MRVPPGTVTVIGVIELERRVTPAVLGGVQVAAGDVNGDGVSDLVAGFGPGVAPHVRVFDGTDGAELRSFDAVHSSAPSDISVATGEITGDGRADVLLGSSDGTVGIWDGGTGQLLRMFAPFDGGFVSPVGVACADVTGDGRADIVVGAGSGGLPVVQVFDGRTAALVRRFDAFPDTFTGGVSVASADVTGDAVADVIVGSGRGGGPNVRVFDGRTGTLVWSFYAFADTFTGGVSVASADVTGDGRADLAVGAGTGGGPQVVVVDAANGELLQSFYAYEPGFSGGVHVASGDLNRDGVGDFLTGAGAGGAPHVRAFDGQGRGALVSFLASDSDVAAGFSIAPIDNTPPTVTLVLPAQRTATNFEVAGVVGDLGSGVAILELAIDGGPFEPVAIAPGGRFASATALPLDGTADGRHVVRIRVTDRAGNTSPDQSLVFELDTRPPTVVGYPQGVQFPAPRSITLTFSEPVTGLSADAISLTSTVNGAVPIESVEAATPTVVQVRVAAPLPEGNYALNVTGVRDLAGNPTAAPRSFPFQVAGGVGSDLVRVREITPADRAGQIDPASQVVVWFDQQVDPAAVASDAALLFTNGWKVPAAVRVAPNKRSVLVQPDAPLQADTEYQVVVDGRRLRGVNGLAVDVNGDGVAGGILVTTFRTRTES